MNPPIVTQCGPVLLVTQCEIMCVDWFYVVKVGWRIFLRRVRNVSGNVKVEHTHSVQSCLTKVLPNCMRW